MERINSTEQIGSLLPKSETTTKRRFSEFSHIELTEDEIEDALNYKRMLKATAMEEDEKKQKRIDTRRRLQTAWDSDQLRTEIMFRTKQLPFEFILDQNNQRVFDLLCLYFTGDERFNREKFIYKDGTSVDLSLRKGIGLISTKKGTGKSVLMSLFQQNKHRPYFQMETKNIASMYGRKGEESIEVHSELLRIPPHPDFFMYDEIGICFDDLGFEVSKNFWGSKSDVMADVLFAIYRKNQMKGNFNWFHFTSNLSGNDFEERYDDRIRDRMREMFNILILNGESRRK
jgi:hypothetical protein